MNMMFKKINLIVFFIILILTSISYSNKIESSNKEIKLDEINNIKNAKSTDNMYLISDYIINDEIKNFFKDTINLNLKTKLLNKNIKLEEDTRLMILLNEKLNEEEDYIFLKEYLKKKNNILIVFNINKNILKYLDIDLDLEQGMGDKNATKIEYKEEIEFLHDAKFKYVNENLFDEYKKIGTIKEYEEEYNLAYAKDNIIIINYFLKDSHSQVIANIIKDNIFKIDVIKEEATLFNASKGELITMGFIAIIVAFNLALMIIMIIYRIRYKKDLFK